MSIGLFGTNFSQALASSATSGCFGNRCQSFIVQSYTLSAVAKLYYNDRMTILATHVYFGNTCVLWQHGNLTTFCYNIRKVIRNGI